MNEHTDLKERIYNAFKSENARITFYDNHPEAEIKFETLSGKVFSQLIRYKRTYEDFVCEFTKTAEEFDPDHYVIDLIIKHAGIKDTPSVRVLIGDAEEIRNRLLTIAAKLRNPIEEYTVTVAIAGSIDIKVNAASFEEAMSLAEEEAEKAALGILDHCGASASHAEDPRGYRHYYE